MRVKHRNLSDKRSKRKIVAENRILAGKAIAFEVAFKVAMIELQMLSLQGGPMPRFAEGGIVPDDVVRSTGRINFTTVLDDAVFAKIEDQLGQGIATLLPAHEANQKKETR